MTKTCPLPSCSLHTSFPDKFLYLLSCTFCDFVVCHCVMLIDINIALISHSLSIRFFIQHCLQDSAFTFNCCTVFHCRNVPTQFHCHLSALWAVSCRVVKHHLHLSPPASAWATQGQKPFRAAVPLPNCHGTWELPRHVMCFSWKMLLCARHTIRPP